MEAFRDRNLREFTNRSSVYWRAKTSETDNYLYNFKLQQINKMCPYNYSGVNPNGMQKLKHNIRYFNCGRVMRNKPQTKAGSIGGSLLIPKNTYSIPKGGYYQDKVMNFEVPY